MGNGWNVLCEPLQFLSATALGLFVGALLTEGVLLVPYWRLLEPSEFFTLHGKYAPRLFGFFAPLTVVAALAAVGAAIASLWAAHAGRWFALLAAGLVVAMIAIYFLYFKRANASFAAATLGVAELPTELARWAFWHWVRVTMGLGAFAASLLALHQPANKSARASLSVLDDDSTSREGVRRRLTRARARRG